jgi:hypothetical protein
MGINHRQKKRIRISIWHQKETYFKKQLGFENVSSRAEVHSKMCDHLIETFIGCDIFFSQNKSCRVAKDPPFSVDFKNINLP